MSKLKETLSMTVYKTLRQDNADQKTIDDAIRRAERMLARDPEASAIAGLICLTVMAAMLSFLVKETTFKHVGSKVMDAVYDLAQMVNTFYTVESLEYEKVLSYIKRDIQGGNGKSYVP